MKSEFKRLIRFEDSEGQIFFGEAPGVGKDENLVGKRVQIYSGTQPWLLSPAGEEREISKILSPIPQVPIIYGVGWNYKSHQNEGLAPPTSKYPLIFTKPPHALAGPYDDIPVNKESRELDYEGELVVVIGKECKNLSDTDDVFDYILGYTVGNDVSSRYWQVPERSNGQHAYAKSFDKFAPVGPVLVSQSVITDPSNLRIVTHVNGERRQCGNTADMVFNIPQVIRHLSRGTTIALGTAIFTGTPAGVAIFMNPPVWLKDGDAVEISIDNIGKIENTFRMEN